MLKEGGNVGLRFGTYDQGGLNLYDQQFKKVLQVQKEGDSKR